MSEISTIEGEVWKPASGLSGYIVSSLGRIVSRRRKTPVLMKFETDKDGYFRVQVIKDDVQVHMVVARVVCETFNGPPSESDMVCCHNDGVRLNNFPANLRWDTQKANIEDKVAHGTHQIGASHPRSLITLEVAQQVKRALNAYPGTRGKLLTVSRQTGVSYPIVADISSGKSWRHA